MTLCLLTSTDRCVNAFMDIKSGNYQKFSSSKVSKVTKCPKVQSLQRKSKQIKPPILILLFKLLCPSLFQYVLIPAKGDSNCNYLCTIQGLIFSIILIFSPPSWASLVIEYINSFCPSLSVLVYKLSDQRCKKWWNMGSQMHK